MATTRGIHQRRHRFSHRWGAAALSGQIGRLCLLDFPGGSNARVLAIATITAENSLETLVGYAAPIVDSIEFHAP